MAAACFEIFQSLDAGPSKFAQSVAQKVQNAAKSIQSLTRLQNFQISQLFVISLAASDLLFCAVNLPLTAARYIHREWTLGPVTCR